MEKLLEQRKETHEQKVVYSWIREYSVVVDFEQLVEDFISCGIDETDDKEIKKFIQEVVKQFDENEYFSRPDCLDDDIELEFKECLKRLSNTN